MTAAQLSLQLILLTAVGILAGRLGIVKGDFDKQLTNLLMKILLPCMIVKSLMGAYSPEALKNSGLLVLLAIGLWAFSFALGQLVYRLTGRSATGRIMRFNMIYTNFTFVGIPVIEALCGELGLFYFVIFVVPYRMVYYSSAQPMLTPPGGPRLHRSFGQQLKGWFSPPVVAVFIGLILYLTQLTLPAPVTGVIQALGSCASPLGMVLCGISLSRYPFKALFRPKYLLYPLVRNLAMPTLFLLAALLLGLERELAQVVVLFGALPTASLLAAFTIQYDPEQRTRFEAAAAVLLSTLFAAVTIPLWAWIIEFCF